MSLNEQLGQWITEKRQTRDTIKSGCATSNRPMVTLSYAQAWDGSITTKSGSAFSLSSSAAIEMTHALRSWHDGILIGIDTVIADDPLLTVREWKGSDPRPIILDSHLRMPSKSKVCQEHVRRPWVLTTAAPDKNRSDCEPIFIVADGSGRVDLNAALELLHSRGIENLMVEGGATVISSFLKQQLADVIVLTIAPMMIGGYKAVHSLLGANGSNFPRISSLNTHQHEDEIVMWGLLEYEDIET